MAETFLIVGFSILIGLGVFMVFIPMLPALFYMLVMTIIFAFVSSFSYISLNELLILSGIWVLSFLADFLSGVLGAKWSGASRKSILYGFTGLIAGTLVLPPFGGVAGLFLGVLISEIIRGKSKEKAFKAATGSIMGVAVGMIINIALALTFLAMFLIFVLA